MNQTKASCQLGLKRGGAGQVGGTNHAPCEARGVASRVGGRGPRLLVNDPPAMLGTGHGDLTRRRGDTIEGLVVGRARWVSTCRQ